RLRFGHFLCIRGGRGVWDWRNESGGLRSGGGGGGVSAAGDGSDVDRGSVLSGQGICGVGGGGGSAGEWADAADCADGERQWIVGSGRRPQPANSACGTDVGTQPLKGRLI